MKRALLLVSLAACDPVYVVRGSAHEACTPEPKPIGGARVTLQCAGVPARDLGETDANGRVVHDAIGVLDPACVVRFAKDGYRPREIAVGELCPMFVSGHCSFVFANAELARETKPAP